MTSTSTKSTSALLGAAPSPGPSYQVPSSSSQLNRAFTPCKNQACGHPPSLHYWDPSPGSPGPETAKLWCGGCLDSGRSTSGPCFERAQSLTIDDMHTMTAEASELAAAAVQSPPDDIESSCVSREFPSPFSQTQADLL